jgi:hypothetical protein
MQRRNHKTKTLKEETKQLIEPPPARLFAIVSIKTRQPEASGLFAQFATAARAKVQELSLWTLVRTLFGRDLGVTSPLITVYGDLPPTVRSIFLVPQVPLLSNLLVAAKDFMQGCAQLDILLVQLQIGRSAVLDANGMCNMTVRPV